MCLACSTPVRGRAYGFECLPSVLGSDALPAFEPGEVRPDGASRVVTLAAFGAGVLATTLPWSRFGPGSGAFGAWTRAGRWSLLALAAAVAGLVLAIVSLRRFQPSRTRDVACVILGGSVALAAALSVMFPPAFSRPWLGPWVALVSGLLACGATVVALRSAQNDTADI
jgi:hypothetical protein